MVLLVHFVGATFGLPSPDELLADPTSAMLAKTALESISIIGVNCFILISGYFGIRASWKGLANFTGWCIFASLVVLGYSIFRGAEISVELIVNSLLVYSSTDLWFVPAYLALFILSPVLNGGLDSLPERKLVWFITGLLFLNVYLGWFRGGKVNQFGYNEMQMVLMYAVGYCIRRWARILAAIPVRICAGLYVFATLGIFFMAFFIPSRTTFAYNSPFVILASVAFFLIFSNMKPFHNRVVNWVASSAFMVYLLHKPPSVWAEIRQCLHYCHESYSMAGFVGASACLFIGIFAICILIDKLRIIVMRPILKRL